jgi:isocitrate dehydrogenase (NAD+)
LLLAAADMLDHLDMVDRGARIRQGIRDTLAAGDRITPDLGGTASTMDLAKAIAKRAAA